LLFSDSTAAKSLIIRSVHSDSSSTSVFLVSCNGEAVFVVRGFIKSRINRRHKVSYLHKHDGSSVTSDLDEAEELANVFKCFYKEDEHSGSVPLTAKVSLQMHDFPCFHRNDILKILDTPVPKKWKHLFVTPIPKRSPHTAHFNYRHSITEHLASQKILSTNLHGFRRGKSTETHMLGVLNEWTSILDDNDNLDIIYFDF
uniref:SAC domain-containing protein n=1 Tax=Heligmosomoides polygyrus TaxID=6339 RepID=A0A8L8KI84_HELPZ